MIFKIEKIKRRHSWWCFAFTLSFVVLQSCIDYDEKVAPTLQQQHASGFSIAYAGNDDFRHGMILQVDGVVFMHDSLVMLAKKISADTQYLPTKRYPVMQTDMGRMLYDETSPVAILTMIGHRLYQKLDTNSYSIDRTRILSAGILYISGKDSQQMQIRASNHYPLEIKQIQ